MARRSTRKQRQANAMLLGGEYIRGWGMIRVEQRDQDPFYAYYDHITLERMTDKQVEYRMRQPLLGKAAMKKAPRFGASLIRPVR